MKGKVWLIKDLVDGKRYHYIFRTRKDADEFFNTNEGTPEEVIIGEEEFIKWLTKNDVKVVEKDS